MNETKYLTRAAASEYLLTVHGVRCSVSTLAKYAMRACGPTYVKVGRRTYYRAEDLTGWIERLSRIVVNN